MIDEPTREQVNAALLAFYPSDWTRAVQFEAMKRALMAATLCAPAAPAPNDDYEVDHGTHIERVPFNNPDVVPAQSVGPVEVLDWLETEVTAISCRYHGDPSYDHDAYWMRDRVVKLIEGARKAFVAPPAQTVQSEAVALEACRAIVKWCDNNPPAGDALWCVQLARQAIAAQPAPGADHD